MRGISSAGIAAHVREVEHAVGILFRFFGEDVPKAEGAQRPREQLVSVACLHAVCHDTNRFLPEALLHKALSALIPKTPGIAWQLGHLSISDCSWSSL